MKPLLIISLLLSSLTVTASANPIGSTPNWLSWQSVGYAQLSWGPWDIYQSELRTPNGQYLGDNQPLALVIRYQRDIDKDDLLEATDDQWKHLGVSLALRQQWLAKLDAIWPDVKEGDRLIFELNGNQGTFYFDGQTQTGIQQLGQLPTGKMAAAFIDIWLSPQTAYPKLRKQLIGQSS